jgi:hypothetical protein
MGVEPWPLTDPATAYLQMTSGAGAAPMHAASAALHALGGSVEGTVVSSTVNAAALSETWSGSGSLASAVSAAAMAGEGTHYSVLSMLKGQLLNAAGELHTTTVPTMVTHVQANANRGEWVFDNGINPLVLGALTGRLIELDGEYFGFMWPNNASAGLRYGAGLDALGAALSGLSALPSLAGGSVAAPAMAAADMGANAGRSMMSAVMSATEQAATAAISPATSGASQAGSLNSQSQLSAPNTSSSMSGVSPLGAVSGQAPVSPSEPQSAPPALGMFAPPAAAALTPSAPTMPANPPVQAMTPSAAPGLTSFAKPAEPFKPPTPPSGGKAVGLKPGMLNASALRGPVGAAPASTALLTKPLTNAASLATEPLAYVTPTVPPSQPAPPSLANLEPGSIPTLNPPPTAPQTPTPPVVPQDSLPASSAGPAGTGSQGTGAQMLGNGPPGAPQAPPGFPPPPLDPQSPVPPTPSPGEPPLSSPAIPSWVTPPVSKSLAALQRAYKDLSDSIDNHNSWRPDPQNLTAVDNYNREAWTLNTWKAQIEGRLGSENAEYTPVKEAVSTDDRYWWTRPAPEGPIHGGPSTQTPDEIRLSQESVIDKLWRYLLDREHEVGGPKAEWFERALGLTRQNLPDLAKQIVFDPSRAWETGVSQFGTKYNEIISVTGANGKTIEILTGWIRGSDGIVKLVTAVPASK